MDITESDLTDNKDLEPKYDEEFVNLQVQFANKVFQVTKGSEREIPFQKALQDLTQLPKLTNLGEAFSTQFPIENADANALTKSIHEKYLERKHLKERNPDRPKDACIYASIEKDGEEDVIFMHFHNSIPGDESPFSPNQVENRRKEIVMAINKALEINPNLKTVTTRSWLCNHKGYRAVYPQEWTESMEESLSEGAFRRFDVWGQFVSKDGSTNKQKAEEFLKKVRNSETVEDLLKAFPYVPLRSACSIEVFKNEPNFKKFFEN